MGIWKDIKHQYNDHTFGQIRKYQRLRHKEANILNRRIFLLRCRSNSVLPSHIKQRFNSFNEAIGAKTPFVRKIDNLTNDFCSKLLNLEIEVTHWSLTHTKTNAHNFLQNIKVSLTHNHFKKITHYIDDEFKRTHKRVKMANIKKYNELITIHNANNFPTTKNRFVNLSDVQIPTDVANILSQGANFALNLTNKFPLLEIIKSLEHTINDNLKGHSADLCRAKCINVVTNTYQKSKLKINRVDSYQKAYINAKKFLTQNPNLIISRSDKGGIVVIMNKQEYDNKMQELLNDESMYKQLNKDMTNIYENKSNDYLQNLLVTGIIDINTYKHHKTKNSLPPRIYGLIKIHKPDKQMRPVVSCINAPSYQLSKLISELIRSSFPSSKFAVKNSIDLKSKLLNINIPIHYELISLDVKALFSNITYDLVESAFNYFIHEFKPLSDVTLTKLLELVMFIFQSTFFKFKETFYAQVQGSAMGNPASPIIAEICMEYLIMNAKRFLNFELPFIHVFVDDIITAIPKGRSNEVLTAFNSIDPHIDFTIEFEKHCTLPFLDMLIIRDENKIVTKWYNKPFAPPSILSYKSSHPLNQKMSTLNSLKIRMISLSDKKFHNEMMSLFRNVALTHDYPVSIINRLINNNVQITDQHNKNINTTKYYKFPYIPNFSENIATILRKYNINLAFCNEVKICKLFTNLKSKIELDQIKNVVYSIPCSDCDKIYIGTTRNKLIKRKRQHLYDCKSKYRSKVNKTALATHHFETGHNFQFDDTTILHIENNYKRRLVSEVLFINKNLSKTVNFKSDTNNLSTMYSYLIEQL